MIKRHFTRAGGDVYRTVTWASFEVSGFPGPVEAPAQWSPTAVEIAATRYFRRRYAGARATDSETSVRQLVLRVSRSLRRAGEWQGYFATTEEASAFEDETAYLLLHQMASFNSPVYFNVGMFAEYGYAGSGENFAVDPSTGQVRPQGSAYVRPQSSACFIQSVRDDLIGIFDLLKSEVLLFKYGSGTGTNFSSLRARGEALEVGGASTGLISYLEIFDKAAQAIRSGGTTRRAAKMVVVDADHPEILDFIRWKVNEERKGRVLIAAGFSGGMDGEAYHTISGQNSNNSIRVSGDFMRRAVAREPWTLRARRDGRAMGEVQADFLLREMARAAWECADPGVHYEDTINSWHKCPVSGPIRASNPCSEFLFLDDTACNLASVNLAAFLDAANAGKDVLNWPAFEQAARVMLFAQDILVDYASYPTAEIALNSHRFRPLGLGYANLGGLLMRLGVPYDSEPAARITSEITASLQAVALEASAALAERYGPFSGFAENRDACLAVVARHLEAARGLQVDRVSRTYESALRAMERVGLRNAQLTLIAPTGTIGLLMDCDTLGIEPDYALIKRKALADGQELRLRNRSVGPALQRLGYSSGQIGDIESHLTRTGTVVGAPGLERAHEAVFDGALPPSGCPERRVSVSGHLRMMAAAQPFLCGAISKTVNLPASSTIEDVEKIFVDGWRMGLKSMAVYRDTSKSLQPLCAEC